MRSLMDLYDIVLQEDKLLIDRLFISLINKKNYNKYREMLTYINNKYNIIQVGTTIEDIMQIDLEKYLTFYFNKYKNNKNEIFSNPLTIELLNSPLLYGKYIQPIINMDENGCFNKIKKHNQVNIYDLYSNYDNPYYIKIMMSLFNRMSIRYCKLSVEQMGIFTNFFIKQQAHELNLNIDCKLIKISEYFKQLLDKQQRKFAIQKISEYGYVSAYHIKTFEGFSLVSFNISNYRQSYLSNEESLIKLLKTIYHECRHALQSNGNVPILSNMDERAQTIINHDWSYYDENHDFFEIEADAIIYGIDRRRYALDHYFPSLTKPTDDNKEKLLLLTNKYQKRFEMEKKVDDILQNHPKYLKNKYDLQKEYFLDGYPKGIMDILKERNITNNNYEIIVYNEIIIRSLNRMNEPELIEKISFINDACPVYLNYIEEAIIYQMNEISKVYSFINHEYQKKNINNNELRIYQEKINNYAQKIQYYYHQFTMIKQIGVAKR